MRFRPFPDTDLTVSEVGFGVWTLTTGWWGEVSDDQAVRMLQQALDLGVTFYDTADTYGSGRGETILAKAFQGRRDEVVYATKFGYDFHSQAGKREVQRELPQDFSPAFIRFACEESLNRLATDRIDFYQLHNPRLGHIEADDLFDTLESLKKEGKVRYYGVALGPANGWLVEGHGAMLDRDLTGLQVIYNLLEQDPGRRFFPLARERGVGILVRVPHSSGMLEGRYTEGTTFDPKDHRSHRPRSWLINGLKKIEHLHFLLENRQATLGQVALKFILAEPSVVSTLPNIYDVEQLREFAAAPGCDDLTAEELEQIDQLYAVNFHVEEPPAEFKGMSEDAPEARAILRRAREAALVSQHAPDRPPARGH